MKHIDLFALTETWVGNSIENFTLTGTNSNDYVIFRNDRKFSGRAGGVAFIVKSKLNPILVDTVEIRKINILVIRIGSLHLINVYIPPLTAKSTDSILALANYLQNFVGENNSLIFGDFNFSNINRDNNLSQIPGPQKLFYDFAKSLDLKQLINFPTRCSSFLDLLFTNMQENLLHISRGSPFGNSDHYSISGKCEISDNHIDQPRNSFKPNYRKAN